MTEQVDHSRRRLLTAATVGTGAIGVAFAAVPFLASWKPSARARALGAPVEVDAAKLEAGQMLKVVWRGQAVFVVRRIQAVCARHDVPMPAAALQFVLAHPAVVSIIPGAARPSEVTQNIASLHVSIPSAFWSELKARGLIDKDAPVPSGA